MTGTSTGGFPLDPPTDAELSAARATLADFDPAIRHAYAVGALHAALCLTLAGEPVGPAVRKALALYAALSPEARRAFQPTPRRTRPTGDLS
ncbi:hypothetical protein [Frankia sp. KB5]|uniref:hypothetical protein n=1 Tax=Frankia sp. KB5 TaxID=683318 RepID=UPI000A105B23|nr:hypothetical protein [Frankia sp. KB5]ORT46987.1 hypothetical protein KBI5_22265 [Frankia sp. KB5]